MRLIKTLFLMMALLIIVTYGYALFLEREHRLELAPLLGADIQACGARYSASSTQYQRVLTWLMANQTGWQQYRLSLPAGHKLVTEKFDLIVFDGGVVANTENGAFSKLGMQKSELNLCN